MNDRIGGVCLVTQPERGQTGKNHTHDLAEIISHITSVSILTANLPSGSSLQNEHEVIEFSSHGTGEHIFIEAWRFFINQIRLCLAIRRREEQVILFFGATSYVLPVFTSRLLGKAVVILPRGDVPLSLRLRWERSLPLVIAYGLANLVRILERINYRTADAIVTYTPAMACQLDLERFEKKLYTDGVRFVDINHFNINIPFKNREQTVGFIGRLDVEKRIPKLSAAVKRLTDSITFIFVGDGDYRSSLETELADEIETGQVEVVGWVNRDEIPEQLNRLQLLVVPSHPTEGLPTVILEAMACGTPVLATPVAGVPDVVREGETGFLIDEITEEEISEDIEAALRQKDLSEVSHKCRELIEQKYSLEGAVVRWQNILESIQGPK